VRSLSAIASALTAILIGLLAAHVFAEPSQSGTAQPTPRAALTATALASVSPLHLRYAQEARPYALWGLLLIVAALAMLHAGRDKRRRSWLLASAAMALALWVHPLTLCAMPALMVLARTQDESRPAGGGGMRRPLTRIALASALAVASWLPWAVMAVAHGQRTTTNLAWTGAPMSSLQLVRRWIGVVTTVFWRPAGEGGLLGSSIDSAAGRVAWLALGLAAVAIVLAAFVHIARSAPRRARAFVIASMAVPVIVLVTADLVMGGRRSTVDRYLMPAWLGAGLAIAFWLAGTGRGESRRRLVLAAILALGVLTALQARTASVWWNTGDDVRDLGRVEQSLAGSATPVVLTDVEPLLALQILRRLPPGATVRLGTGGPARIEPSEWPRVILVHPSSSLLGAAQSMAVGGRFERDPATAALWRLFPVP
jgi:uncharacterized membrane protein